MGFFTENIPMEYAIGDLLKQCPQFEGKHWRYTESSRIVRVFDSNCDGGKAIATLKLKKLPDFRLGATLINGDIKTELEPADYLTPAGEVDKITRAVMREYCGFS